MRFPVDQWALVLGGSSGLGLATAKKLARHGMNIAVVHRDRRGAMRRIEPEFDEIRDYGVRLIAYNADALAEDSRRQILDSLRSELGEDQKLRVLLHSIAFGNLKPIVEPRPRRDRHELLERMAGELGVGADRVASVVDRLFADGFHELHTLTGDVESKASPAALIEDEDLARTIYSMGTSLLSWVQDALAHGLFATDARVVGLTSEGNEIAWRGYAAVAAAKVAMESLSRSMALELAPYGIRSNIVQAGITETPASSLIPGIARMKAEAELRNPFGRLTRPEDVADFIYLLSTDEAAWVNGSILRVDGGEHISGGAG